MRRWFPDPLPADVDTGAVRRFLEGKLPGRSLVVVALTGPHAYGFPSRDSDLDLKGIHAAPASSLLARAALSRRCAHHYRGFLHAMKRESDLEAGRGLRSAKRLLYAYRVAFTGVHLLLEKRLVTDVRALAPVYGFAAPVEELFARKRSAEHAGVDGADRFLADLPKLAALLDDAEARFPVPAAPDDDAVRALDAFLVDARTRAR